MARCVLSATGPHSMCLANNLSNCSTLTGLCVCFWMTLKMSDSYYAFETIKGKLENVFVILHWQYQKVSVFDFFGMFFNIGV